MSATVVGLSLHNCLWYLIEAVFGKWVCLIKDFDRLK